jgi:hypothetical protein
MKIGISLVDLGVSGPYGGAHTRLQLLIGLANCVVHQGYRRSVVNRMAVATHLTTAKAHGYQRLSIINCSVFIR